MDIIQPIKEEVREDSQYDNTSITGGEDASFLSLKSYFDKDLTPEENSALKYILEDLKGREITDIIWTIRETERKLGVPTLGQSKIMQLKQYFKINKEIIGLEKLRDSYER